MDNLLIYSDGSKKDHLKKVRLVLERLAKAGLKLDIKGVNLQYKFLDILDL